MARTTATRLLAGLTAAGLFLTPATTRAQVSRRTPAARAPVTRARIPVFSGVHPTAGGGQKTIMAPAVPSLRDFDKMQMTTMSLPGADVHGAGGTLRLSASQPVVRNGKMSVAGALTQPEFGMDGSVMFDSLGTREAGNVLLQYQLTDVGRPHVLDCAVSNTPWVDWTIHMGTIYDQNNTQVFAGGPPSSDNFKHLSTIIVPAQAGNFLIWLHPKPGGPLEPNRRYALLFYCEMTVLH